jgi:hypothetical protein
MPSRLNMTFHCQMLTKSFYRLFVIQKGFNSPFDIFVIQRSLTGLKEIIGLVLNDRKRLVYSSGIVNIIGQGVPQDNGYLVRLAQRSSSNS